MHFKNYRAKAELTFAPIVEKKSKWQKTRGWICREDAKHCGWICGEGATHCGTMFEARFRLAYNLLTSLSRFRFLRCVSNNLNHGVNGLLTRCRCDILWPQFTSGLRTKIWSHSTSDMNFWVSISGRQEVCNTSYILPRTEE